MRLWQKVMIACARSDRMKTFMQGRAMTTALARQFVGGSDLPQAMQTVRRLHADGVRASLFYLGEYVTDASAIQATIDNVNAVAEALGHEGRDVHISIDPTQIGYSIAPNLWEENAWRVGKAIAQHAGPGRHCLMLDMEDFELVDPTLAMHARLREARIPVAQTLQAYLHRTESDLDTLVREPNMVRLVKGAFAEHPERALQGRDAVDAAYLRLAEKMLSPAARSQGFYPVFGTHDDRLMVQIQALAASNGWEKGQYEFEMLFGVRTWLLHTLRDQGETVRVYLPFGRDWWPYAIRRVGESPRNAWFAGRALWGALTGRN